MFSETHNIQYEIQGATATLSMKGNPCDQPAREFILLVGLQDIHKDASAVVEVHETPFNKDERTTAVMLFYFPTYVFSQRR
jgi:hypothetical protein